MANKELIVKNGLHSQNVIGINTSVVVGNTSVYSAQTNISANTTLTNSGIKITDGVNVNCVINATTMFVGNTVAYVNILSGSVAIVNSTANLNFNTTTFFAGNSTLNVVGTSSSLKISNSTHIVDTFSNSTSSSIKTGLTGNNKYGAFGISSNTTQNYGFIYTKAGYYPLHPRVNVVTSNTTFALPIGCKKVEAFIIGAGGAGKNVATSSAGQATSGTGGCSGQTVRLVLNVESYSSLYCTVAPYSNNSLDNGGAPSVGANSSLGTNATAINYFATAYGGFAGNNVPSATTFVIVEGEDDISADIVNTSAVGYISHHVSSNRPMPLYRASTTALGSPGGPSFLGGCTNWTESSGNASFTQASSTPPIYGAGGAGVVSENGAAGGHGDRGAPGVIILYQYFE